MEKAARAVIPGGMEKAAMSEVMQTGRVAVSRDRHGGRFWRRFDSYGFARPLRCVPVVLAEIEQAASAFPLVFRRDAETGRIEIVALLHLTAEEPTPFVTTEGTWRGTYVPSALRAHPFAAAPSDQGDDMALLVDEASGLVTDDPKDEPFFDAAGAPSAALEQVITFFRTRATSAQATAAACAALDAAGLLTPLAPLSGMTGADARGFLAVDPEALAGIDAPTLWSLWQGGALRLAQGHRVSLCHAGWMARALQAGAGATPRGAHAKAPPDAGLTGFLDALAEAQNHDRGDA